MNAAAANTKKDGWHALAKRFQRDMAAAAIFSR